MRNWALWRRRIEDRDPDEATRKRTIRTLRPSTLDPRAADDDAIIEGTLRAPWKWETLIVESAVIGGDPTRWHRRLTGLANEMRAARWTPSARMIPIRRKRRASSATCATSAHLRAFALPIVDRLATWPAADTWGAWLDRFAAIAPMVLRRPEGVLRVLQQLRPMAEIGPVSLEEARDVIADRLQTLEIDPPKSRYGRVFVGSPQQARGRTFRVVFVAGLAERMFPQRPHEDPMLLDREMREPLGAGLALQEDRARSGAPSAASGRRRADRAAVAVVSADRDRRIAAAGPELLRARHHARDHRPHPEAAAAPGIRRRRGRRGSGLAGTRAAGRRDRRSRARPCRPPAAAPGRAARVGAGPRALPAAAERAAQAVRHGALGARAIAVDAVRRHHARDRHDQVDAGVAAARRAAVLAVGACRSSRRVRTSSCSPRSTASSRRRPSSRSRSSIR